MGILKYNYELVPSSWIRWVLLCGTYDYSLKNNLIDDDERRKIIEHLYEEICNSSLPYPVGFFSKESHLGENDIRLQSLMSFTHRMAEYSKSMLSHNLSEDEIHCVEDIIDGLNQAEEIIKFVLDNFYVNRERYVLEEKAWDNEQGPFYPPFFTFFPSLSTLWSKLNSDWQILEIIPQGDLPLTDFDIFTLTFEGEPEQQDWLSGYAVDKGVKPVLGKGIQIYALMTSLCYCSDYKEDKKEWYTKVFEKIDWRNPRDKWIYQFLKKDFREIKSNLNKTDEEILTQLFDRKSLSVVLSPDNLLLEGIPETICSTSDILKNILVFTNSSKDRIGHIDTVLSSGIEELVHLRDSIPDMYVSKQEESYIHIYNEDYWEEMSDANDWFKISLLNRCNVEDVVEKLNDWVENYDYHHIIPETFHLNSSIVESLVDNYIKDYTYAKYILFGLKHGIGTDTDTYRKPLTHLNKTSKLAGMLGVDTNSEIYRTFHKLCDDDCLIRQYKKTKFIEELFGNELFRPKTDWKTHLIKIRRNYIPQNLHGNFNFEDENSCIYASFNQKIPYGSDKETKRIISLFLDKQDFNVEEFDAKYRFIFRDEHNQKMQLNGDEIIRSIKDATSTKIKIVQAKIEKYFK